VSSASLHHYLLRQVYDYIADNRLPDDRSEEALIPVQDARIGVCNVPKLVRTINKVAQMRASYARPHPCVRVLDLRKIGADNGFVVLAPTVGLGSLVG
jgi:hypothetical protein